MNGSDEVNDWIPPAGPERPPLEADALGPDPFPAFRRWLADAEGSDGMRYPNAVVLSTLDEDGFPGGRVVLLKELDERGFVFFSNYESEKGRALEAHPRAGLTFYWDGAGRQVRVKGPVERVTAEESDAYFRSRPRGSRIGAWASAQSRTLESRGALLRSVAEFTLRFGIGEVPRPPHWGGYRLVPTRIEFWQEGLFRLHDRFRFSRSGAGEAWSVERLNP